MGLIPGTDPAQVAQTQSHNASLQGEAGGSSTQDSMKVTEEALFSVPSFACLGFVPHSCLKEPGHPQA